MNLTLPEPDLFLTWTCLLPLGRLRMPPRRLLPSALRFIDPSTRSRGPDVPQHPAPVPPSFRRPSRPAASVDWLCSGLFQFLIRLWSVRTARVHRTYMTPPPSDSRVLQVGVWFHHRLFQPRWSSQASRLGPAEVDNPRSKCFL